MENIQVKTLCQIRDVYRSIVEFEMSFQQNFNICLNEGMLLCSLNTNECSSSEIAELLGLTNSNTSKVIKSVETKGLVKRIVGKEDKRQMYFVLTELGRKKLQFIKCSELNMPELLKSLILE